MRNAAPDQFATAATASAGLSLGALAAALVLASASPATTVVLLGLLGGTLWAAVCTRALALQVPDRRASRPATGGAAGDPRPAAR